MPAPGTATLTVQCPLGPLTLTSSPVGLCSLRFERAAAHPGDASSQGSSTRNRSPERDLLLRASALVARYFEGADARFDDLPLDLRALTPFRRSVVDLLRSVPAGTLVTYGALADRAGCLSARAIGQAVGANPLPIIVPCHRVVARDRRLGGFSAGLERKVALLEHEGFCIARAAAHERVEEPDHGSRITFTASLLRRFDAADSASR